MRFMTSIGAALAASLVLACGPSAREMQEIRESLQQISTKLESIETTLSPLRAAAQPRQQEDFNKVYKIEVGDSPIKGNPNAPVTLVVYSDFQCPYCAKADPELKELAAKFPEKLRVVFKHFPLGFHEAARPLAIASMAAQEQGRFWEFHDVVFKSNNSLAATDAAIEGYAKAAGLDLERFKRDRTEKAEAYGRRIDQEIAQGNGNDVRGTPTLFINGKKVQNRSIQGMSQMVETAASEPKTGG